MVLKRIKACHQNGTKNFAELKPGPNTKFKLSQKMRLWRHLGFYGVLFVSKFLTYFGKIET